MRTRRMTVGAGWSMVAIGVLHTAVFLPHPYWAEWLSGGLRSSGDPESLTTFWALPGGFVPALVLLGLLVARTGRRGETPPAYVGWGIGAWALVCVGIIGLSGFVLGLIPAVLLVADHFRARRGEPHRPGAAEAGRAPAR